MPEFVTPDPARPDGLQEHIARYEFVRSFCHGKTVLDAGCGSGYGTAMLAAVARRVCGVDLNPEALTIAKARWPDLLWVRADIHRLPLRDCWDVLVMLEVIEHLAGPKKMLRNLPNVKLAFISTPAPPKHGQSEFHVREYRLDEFHRLLHTRFHEVSILAQCGCGFDFDPYIAEYYMAICRWAAAEK